MTRTRWCLLDSEDAAAEAEMARVVDELLEAVATALALPLPETLTPYETTPLRIWQQTGAEISRLAKETGATTLEAKGLCLTDTCVLVQRLEYEWTLAHEMAHALGKRVGRRVDCAAASKAADAVA